MQRISAQKKKYIERLLKDGASVSEVAKASGVSINTVARQKLYMQYGDDFKAERTSGLPENFERDWDNATRTLLKAFKNGVFKNPIQLTTRG